MILTTTNNIENHKIVDYLGIVTGTEIKSGHGNMTFKASFSTDNYNKNIKKQLFETEEEAFQQLTDNAKKLGANAVVGITVAIEVTNQIKIVVSVTGTAVKVV